MQRIGTNCYLHSSMKKKMLTAISLILLSTVCMSQIYIEPFIGYQSDMNSGNFRQFNTGIQSSFKFSKTYELVFQVQKSWPNTSNGTDSSFSLNPNFPLYAPAQKSIRPSSFTITFGNRIRLTNEASLNALNLILNIGFCDQSIEVKYNYDKSNYTILNPDQTQDRSGVYFGGGIEYMRLLRKGRVFIQMTVSTPPAGDKIKYPSTFNVMAPIAVNVGYSFMVSKKKNGK